MPLTLIILCYRDQVGEAEYCISRTDDGAIEDLYEPTEEQMVAAFEAVDRLLVSGEAAESVAKEVNFCILFVLIK